LVKNRFQRGSILGFKLWQGKPLDNFTQALKRWPQGSEVDGYKEWP